MVNSLNDGLSIPDQVAQGLAFQAGSFVASAATTVVTFSPSFRAAPAVQITMAQSGTIFPTVSGNAVSAGSVSFTTVSGTAQLYHWVAVGNL